MAQSEGVRSFSCLLLRPECEDKENMAVSGTAGDLAVPPFTRVGQPAELPAALEALDIAVHRPVLVLVGGAGGMTPDQLTGMAEAMERITPALDRWGAAVVDGGTDSGVMRVMGQIRDMAGASFPLVGVAAEGTLASRGRPAPSHSNPITAR